MAAASTSSSSSNPMAGAASWPPALKAFVTQTFAQCTDANREKVETELKKRIFDAFSNKTLWSTDWASVQLDALKPSTKRKKPSSGIVPIPSAHLSAVTSASSPKVNPLNPTIPDHGELDMRQKRLKRFQADSGSSDSSLSLAPMSLGKNNKGKGKAKAGGMNGLSLKEQRNMSGTPDPVFNPDVIDWDDQTIVGTSRQLEKPYLRLTSAPDPKTVRPLPILRQTLEHLKKKWRTENNYAWVCDQFKSMRQDLTVQRIKNDFTVMTYEIHARIALEKGDLGEYNQCQSQLRELYKHGLEGHPMEFLAYRILYLVHTRNRSDFNSLLASLTPEQRADEGVQHALGVRTAVATSNYHQFFKLFLSAPKMGPYLMDHFVDRERVNALVIMTKAYKTLPLSYIANELAFDDTTVAHDFLARYNAAIYVPEATTAQQSNGGIPNKPISISLFAQPKVAMPHHSVKKTAEEPVEEEDKRQLDCKFAHAYLTAAAQTFTKVDIKGQI